MGLARGAAGGGDGDGERGRTRVFAWWVCGVIDAVKESEGIDCDSSTSI